MVTFVLQGSAGDIGFAKCERLLDILEAVLPDCSSKRTMKHPEEWPSQQRTIQNKMGFLGKLGDVLVWSSEGRLIGGAEEFSEYVYRYYQVECDLDAYRLGDHVQENLQQALKQRQTI